VLKKAGERGKREPDGSGRRRAGKKARCSLPTPIYLRLVEYIFYLKDKTREISRLSRGGMPIGFIDFTRRNENNRYLISPAR